MSQFHYGSIQIMDAGGRRYRGKRSQFHYGSIQIVRKTEAVTNAMSSLNSTMVRFKLLSSPLEQSIKSVSIPLWFDSNEKDMDLFTESVIKSQFHYGSIQIGK